MMMDLFDVQPIAPARPPQAPVWSPPRLPVPKVPQGGIAWERLIAVLGEQEVVIYASALWTGFVLELAAHASFGRKMLRHDGAILDVQPDRSVGRTIYVTIAHAEALDRKHGLVLLGRRGGKAAMLRFAREGEDTNQTAAILADVAQAAPSAFL